MTACDTIITKAGPGTIAEALICGLPIILNGFIPCQVWAAFFNGHSGGFHHIAALPIILAGSAALIWCGMHMQEEGNVPFVVDNKVGLFERKPAAIAAVLQHWLTNDEAEYSSFARAGKRDREPMEGGPSSELWLTWR